MRVELDLDSSFLRSQEEEGSVAAATALASSVGSVVGLPKEAFLKSFTYFAEVEENNGEGSDIEKENSSSCENRSSSVLSEWGLQLEVERKGGILRSKTRLKIKSLAGSILQYSRISEGEYLKMINGKKLGPSLMNPEVALRRMEDSLAKDGYLSIAVKNTDEEADDILVHATILKPRPDMTCRELGMIVWHWGYSCIKELTKDSYWAKTALRETDQIISVNDIVCNELRPTAIERIIDGLPHDITVTVLRRKERATGKFG